MNNNTENSLEQNVGFLKKFSDDRFIEFSFWDTWIKLYIPFSHSDLIQKAILQHKTFYEHYLLLKVLKYIPKEAIIADVGANIGNHTVFFGKVCNAKMVFSFEPLNVAYKILQKNIEINELTDKVTAFNFAIGKKEGYMDLIKFFQANIGGSMFKTAPNGNYKVCRLDDINFPKLDFLKIDVEGSQDAVFFGAEMTIKKFAPIIWAEIRDIPEEAPVFSNIESMGYYLEEKIGKTDYIFKSHGKFR